MRENVVVKAQGLGRRGNDDLAAVWVKVTVTTGRPHAQPEGQYWIGVRVNDVHVVGV